MYILIGDTKIEWKIENTKQMQIDSLNNFAIGIGYKPITDDITKGYRVSGQYRSYHKTTNHISFKDMCLMHNFISRAIHEKPDLNNVNLYSLASKIKIDHAIFHKQDYFLTKLLTNTYPLKLVEKVRLQKCRKEPDNLKLTTQLVNVTAIGETYLEQNYFLFRKNMIIVK